MKTPLFKHFSIFYTPLLLAVGLGAPLASQAQYTPGNLVVVQVGDGATFTGNTVVTKLVEFSPAGLIQNTAALNATDPGNKLTNTDNSPTEGMLTLSTDGRYLLTTGYNAQAGTAATSTASATVARTVARIDANRNADISTVLADTYNGSNSVNGSIRSAASLNGSAFWLAGAGSGATGLRYAPVGASTSTGLSNTITSTRVVRIMRNNVYFSTGASTPGIYLLGPANNTSSGQAATLLISTGANSSPYSFILLDRDPAIAGPDAAYIADENDGLGKWAFDGTNWAKVGVLSTKVRGLTGTINPTGSVTLYATTRSSAGSNELVTVTDTNPYTAAISASATTSLYKSGANVALRGVEFAPGTAVVLPVVLTGFAATRAAAGVQLHWRTASEVNSARFEVERSVDGVAFGPVATMAAAGTTQQPRTYAHLDASAPASRLYYRLRQVDLDGSAHYSPVATVSGADAGLTLSPNPIGETLYLTTEQPVAYAVRTTLGQPLLQGTTAAGATPIAVASLPAGVYFVELATSTGRVVQRFVKE